MDEAWKASLIRQEAEEKEEEMDSRSLLGFRGTVSWWLAVVGMKGRRGLG